MDQSANEYTIDIDFTFSSAQAGQTKTTAPSHHTGSAVPLKPLAGEAPQGKWAALKEKLYVGFMKALDCETMKNAKGRDFENEEIELIHTFLKERGEDKVIHNSRGIAV